jgi:drug/metabolite transporter (DMT)-like permease
MSSRISGILLGIAAAALFGASAPVAKLLLRDVTPLLLSALLYCGAGLAMLAALPFAPRRNRGEAPLRRADLPLLLFIVVSGGMAGPLLMLYGLQRVSGITGSLLLNLEAPMTILIAVAFFREHLHRREALAVVLILLGGVVLSIEPGEIGASWSGVWLLAAACACWGIDNNLTQRLTLKDPFAIVAIKGGGAGLVMLATALAIGKTLPSGRLVAAALSLGAVSYGVSILLDAYALRILGAAREAAIFATAPFAGAILAVPLLQERFGLAEGGAAAAMIAGIGILLRSRHEHLHSHTALAHEHAHVHDEHHQHEHPEGVSAEEPHSHPHQHAPLTHQHPHVSDSHHRHEH